MTTIELAIQAKALSLGYEKCGLIKISEVGDYAGALQRRIDDFPSERGFLERLRRFAGVAESLPWAKSIIICATGYGRYKIPENLKGRIGSIFLATALNVAGMPDYDRSRAFGEFLAAMNIRAETDRKAGLTAMRWAAMKAGLGLVRRNNFFYSESGSKVALEAWVIDRELELKEQNSLKPCPENCDKCIKACPTSSLAGPYSMRPSACITYLSAFGDGRLNDNPHSPQMGGWIYGCDCCQSACPFNKAVKSEDDDYPGLDDLAARLSLTRIIDMDYDSLARLLPQRFWYISENKLWRWKVNVLNAMKNDYRAEFKPWILKAQNDSAPEVRSMAAWALAGIV